MTIRKSFLEFASDINQLPFKGSPATYVNYNNCVTYVTDQSFDSDGVPQTNRKFSLKWPALDDSYSPIYTKFRVRNESLNAESNWFIPIILYSPVRYSIFKRRVATEPNSWFLVETTTNNYVNSYQENWAGRVQYAVCIYHKNGVPSSSEGNNWVSNYPTDVTNKYVLFMTNPNDSVFDTRPYHINPL